MPTATTAIPTEGTILSLAIASTMTEIALVTDIDGPATLVAAIEKTHLTSTKHEYRPSKIPNPDKLTFKMWFDPNDTAMHGLIAGRLATPGTIDDFKLTFIDTNVVHASATFSGFFTSFKPSGIKTEDNLTADAEVQLTTIVTYTPGAAS